MQLAVPKGKGGMVAVLGAELGEIYNLLKENNNKYTCYDHTESTVSNNNIIKNEKIKEKNQEKIQEKIHEKKEIQEKFEHLKTLRQQAEEIIKKKEKILMVIK